MGSVSILPNNPKVNDRMNRNRTVSIRIVAWLALGLALFVLHARADTPRAAYARLPLSFVPNAGQMDPSVRYSAQSGRATFYFTMREAVFSFAEKSQGLVLRLRFLGANPNPVITGQTAQVGKVNYFIGNDPAKWHTNLPTYGEIIYRNLWPHIDLVFRSENGQLQYKFLLRPGARVQDIQLAYRGAKRLSVDGDGNLTIHTSLRNFTDTRPFTYQLLDGKRVQVASRFGLQPQSKTRFGFIVGAYDYSRDLVLDPGLVYSTYLGGTGDDGAEAIAVDSAGQGYIAGWTYSATDFPTTSGAYRRTNQGSEDVFVAKLNSSGSALIYSTYLGGTSDEPYWSASIAVDPAGYPYVAGTTLSPDFPTTPGAFQTTLKGFYNAFVTKLNRDGSSLVYSTYLGGSVYDGAYYSDAIAVDRRGNAYVTGFANSPDFPTTPGAYQTSLKGPENAFVTKLNTTGTGLVYSTYLGGSSYDSATGVAVDSDGEAYLTGYTYSTDFPTRNPYQSTNHGGANAFVTELNRNGTDLIYSTYLGGTGFDAGGAITVDWSGSAYVVGDAGSSDFPTTPGAFQTTYSGGADDVFVTKLNRSGSALVYSTYLGGTLNDYANAITVDTAGQAYVTGFTNSMNFPTTPGAYNTTFNGAGPPWFYGDAFVTKLNSHGNALVYSTYLGGSGDDLGLGIALDRADKVYVAGSTNSTNFPTTAGAFDTTYNGAGPPYFYGDAFVTKLDVPAGEAGCDKADGDGEADDNEGRKNHFHFHKKSSCPDQADTENDNVQADDDGSGPRFQSTLVTSATYTVADTNQAVTMVGTGLHNGLPVTFTMVAVNYGDVAPGVFQITLTDGYSFIGSIVSGGVDIR
jgi:beta-propeller repeat-containing protein